MNTLTLQKETTKLEKAIKKASRILFEFEMKQSEWEIAQGKGKKYKSADAYIRHIKREIA